MEGKTRKQIERLVAREGLIFLGMAVASLLLKYYADVTFLNYRLIHPPSPATSSVQPPTLLECFIWLYGVYATGWAFYFIIRFIIWAIRTLKAKE